jgi:hypothetical protein
MPNMYNNLEAYFHLIHFTNVNTSVLPMYSCLQKKNGNCQNKIDTFLQFHSVKPSRDRLELTSKLNDIIKN